jgi:excisionase family DNA binding protein
MSEPWNVTITDVMNYFAVSESTIRKWVRNGTLTGIQVSGKCLRFRQSDLDALVANSRTDKGQEDE